MNVQLHLDPHGPYTNLDLVTGKVILHNPSSTTISHITVKLEAESRTRLLAPPSQDPRQNRRNEPRPVLEVHKVHLKLVTCLVVVPSLIRISFSIKSSKSFRQKARNHLQAGSQNMYSTLVNIHIHFSSR